MAGSIAGRNGVQKCVGWSHKRIRSLKNLRLDRELLLTQNISSQLGSIVLVAAGNLGLGGPPDRWPMLKPSGPPGTDDLHWLQAHRSLMRVVL